MIKAVLFDLDGTLADTAPDMARTVNEMCRSRGLPAVEVAKVRPHVSSGARGMLRAAFDVTPDDAEYLAMREEFLQIYGQNLCVDSQLFPGMPELLAWLESRGISWGVVTNKYERLARPLIESFGLADRAGVIVGGDTCKRAKPFPDPLLHAIEILGVAPERTLYVGDDERDVQAARAAGMPVIVAGYGYLGDEPAPELWGSDGVIASPEGVQAWIRAHASQETV
jgi:phosphoglycolate phosphatase